MRTVADSRHLAPVWVPWTILTFSFLVADVGNTLYALFELSPSPVFGTLSRIMPLAAIWYWFWHYLVARGVPVHVDTGLFLSVAPFLVVPIQVLRAGRWRGLFALFCLATVYLAARVWSFIVRWAAGAV